MAHLAVHQVVGSFRLLHILHALCTIERSTALQEYPLEDILVDAQVCKHAQQV